MANAADIRFFRRLTETLGRLGNAKARPSIPSRTLRRALVTIRVTDQQVKMHITHYWARFVHDGRNAKTLGGNRFMAWYKNPREDPRLRGFGGQTPPRVTQLLGLKQVLSREQFKRDRRAGKIVFSQHVSKVTGTPFFSNEAGGGMNKFVDEANRVAGPLTQQHILRRIGKENLNEKDVAVLTLGLFAD